MVTVTVGAASLATAGVVAYNLPGPAHAATVNGTAATPAATQHPQENGSSDDGGGEGGTAVTAPGSTIPQAPAHATSGGS